jgi:hypothetical protein
MAGPGCIQKVSVLDGRMPFQEDSLSRCKSETTVGTACTKPICSPKDRNQYKK